MKISKKERARTEHHLNPKKNLSWAERMRLDSRPVMEEEDFAYALRRMEYFMQNGGASTVREQYIFYQYYYKNGAEVVRRLKGLLESPLAKALR